ncbi:MAG: baseplate hub protein [Myxococcota bacterium]
MPRRIRLFRRRYDLTVGGLRFGGTVDPDTASHLHVSFTVTKNLRRHPNDCTISLVNLSPDSRRRLEQLDTVPVKLLAGYEQEMAQIFVGRLRDINTERDGPDLVTTIEGLDGGQQHKAGRVNRSFAKDVSIGDVLKQVVRDVGESIVGEGNLSDVLGRPEMKRKLTQGMTLQGHATEELERVATAAGLEWSVQDERLQFLLRGRALEGEAVRLAPDTGLIGSPSIDNEGLVTVRSLMIPDVWPGRRLKVEGEFLDVTIRADRCVYTGDSRGEEWSIESQGKEG